MPAHPISADGGDCCQHKFAHSEPRFLPEIDAAPDAAAHRCFGKASSEGAVLTAKIGNNGMKCAVIVPIFPAPETEPSPQPEMRLEHAERPDQDSRGGLLRQRAPAPTLAQCPIFHAPIAANNMLDARSRQEMRYRQHFECRPHLRSRIDLRNDDDKPLARTPLGTRARSGARSGSRLAR